MNHIIIAALAVVIYYASRFELLDGDVGAFFTKVAFFVMWYAFISATAKIKKLKKGEIQ